VGVRRAGIAEIAVASNVTLREFWENWRSRSLWGIAALPGEKLCAADRTRPKQIGYDTGQAQQTISLCRFFLLEKKTSQSWVAKMKGQRNIILNRKNFRIFTISQCK